MSAESVCSQGPVYSHIAPRHPVPSLHVDLTHIITRYMYIYPHTHAWISLSLSHSQQEIFTTSVAGINFAQPPVRPTLRVCVAKGLRAHTSGTPLRSYMSIRRISSPATCTFIHTHTHTHTEREEDVRGGGEGEKGDERREKE